MIYGNDHWWNFVIALEEKREQFESQHSVGLETLSDEDYGEYVLIIALLGPLYKHLTEGGIWPSTQ